MKQICIRLSGEGNIKTNLWNNLYFDAQPELIFQFLFWHNPGGIYLLKVKNGTLEQGVKCVQN